ncbi:hypothetical protein [Cellulomonas soli]
MPFDESHVDEETLALLALGENAGSDAERAHVAGCEHCTHELDALRDVVGLARDAGPDALTPPPPAVWERVVAELGLTAAGSPAPAATAPVAAAPRRVRWRPPRWSGSTTGADRPAVPPRRDGRGRGSQGPRRSGSSSVASASGECCEARALRR